MEPCVTRILHCAIAASLLLAAHAAAQSSVPSPQYSITVTATRTEARVADTPASVVVLSREMLAASASPTIDDALRQVPGFALFRRTGSRVANPTSQGVSLRGIGASGASRAVVLDDGIPLNDPFGGWVYWGRVARLGLERIEVLRGGASDLYGSSAMGGVVQFIRRRDEAVAAEVTAGSQGTTIASLFASTASGDRNAAVTADLFETGGYRLVEGSSRGAVDRAADSRHRSVELRAGRGALFARLGHYAEERNNGTPLQTNETSALHAAIGFDRGAFSTRAWGSDQDYEQTFSAIAANRAGERLTVEQSVPARGTGVSAQYATAAGTRHALVTGVEARQVSGTSDELQYAFNGGTSRVVSSGRQRTVSAFVEDVISVTGRLSATAGVRVDAWRNFDAERNGAALGSSSATRWNPRLAVLFRANDALAVSASAYGAFRAPTLNELYRGFRVGNVVTNANEELGPETLHGFEIGARGRHVRANVFWMETSDAIANVTIATTPSLITRQRQNAGTSTSRGAEVEGEWLVRNRWRISAGYLFTDATLDSGKRVPQVARNQATAQLLYAGRGTAGMQLRWSAMQFDDDLNELPLDDYFVADLFASYPLVSRLSIVVAAENVFDERIEAGATPVITLGQPRAWRVGARWGR